MSLCHKAALGLSVAAGSFALLAGALAPMAFAEVDPAGCTSEVGFDASVPTFDEVWLRNHPGDTANAPLSGTNASGGSARHLTQDLYAYGDALVAATADNPRVKVVMKNLGKTVLGEFGNAPGGLPTNVGGVRTTEGQQLKYYVVGTKENIDNLDAGRNDGAFWSGVVSGTVPASTGLAEIRQRPAFVWFTETPHGNEPAGGEAVMKQLYELAARTDCANARRLSRLDVFLDPARNPDGRDNGQRTTAWGYDPNRDFGTRNQPENRNFLGELTKYPGLFYIDAHQQSSGYFFPPNQDPVLHEISSVSRELINGVIGPAVQRKFNDQNGGYFNYLTYDLFAPVFGDTVPSLLMGAAGMTYEKGTADSYGKQVYDHYLAGDTTINTVAARVDELQTKWVNQWQQATDEGARCELAPNALVSPVNSVDLGGTQIQQPTGSVCGYFYKPDLHSGDVARLMREMLSTGVQVFRLDQAVTVPGVHAFGTAEGVTGTDTLPAGTLFIPSAQPQKHWLQSVLGENPFIPYAFHYDVVSWSYNLNRGLAGNGMLTQNMPSGTAMTKLSDVALGAVPAAPAPVYAFNTDSAAGLGMVTELLDQGATVFRAASGFDADGRRFFSGAALVDGASLASEGIDLGPISLDRQTPVYGLPNYPVARYAMQVPKIGVYTNTEVEPTNPLRPGAGTGQCTTAAYCSAVFTLTQKNRVPGARVLPITSTALAAGNLVSQGFTAFVNPGSTIAAGTGATALQAFVNNGGRYVGIGAGGTTSARNAQVSNLNTNPLGVATCGTGTPPPSATSTCFETTGSTFLAGYQATNPVAWGYDLGGFVYRSVSGDPLFDRATLAATSGSAPGVTPVVPAIPAGAVPVEFPQDLKVFGYERNAATGDKRLAGRPAVVDQPFGTGRSVLFSFDPFYRAWHEGSERVVLNAVLYPSGAPVAASPPRASRTGDGDAAGEPTEEVTGAPAPSAAPGPASPTTKAQLAAALEPTAKPVPKAKLAKVANRPVKSNGRSTAADVYIEVHRWDAKALRKAVKAARVPAKLLKRAKYTTTKKIVRFSVPNGAPQTGHRPYWTGRIVGYLLKHKVKPIAGKLG